MNINQIYFGNNLELLKQLEPNSIHSCVSDFPYNLGFMGRKWDTISNYYEWCFERAKELYRVLIPGAYCLIFGGTRTHHRLVCAFEDAGFEIKDEMQWIYGSGFPKSYNISKGFDKQAGVQREVVGITSSPNGNSSGYQGERYKEKRQTRFGVVQDQPDKTKPVTNLAKQWDGWGTALKPAQEPIMVAQKPIEKNYCYNIEKYGVGGLNIDDSRIGTEKRYNPPPSESTNKWKEQDGCKRNPIVQEGKIVEGRFPANIIFDEVAAEMLDKQTGILKIGSNCVRRQEGSFLEHGGLGKSGDIQITYGDSGGASRFFYCAKATNKDKNENGLVNNTHVTVKPTDLIKYLVRLVTPKNGICLDICEGSGTHAKACILLTKEGYPVNYIGFENDKDSYDISLKRVACNL